MLKRILLVVLVMGLMFSRTAVYANYYDQPLPASVSGIMPGKIQNGGVTMDKMFKSYALVMATSIKTNENLSPKVDLTYTITIAVADLNSDTGKAMIDAEKQNFQQYATKARKVVSDYKPVRSGESMELLDLKGGSGWLKTSIWNNSDSSTRTEFDCDYKCITSKAIITVNVNRSASKQEVLTFIDQVVSVSENLYGEIFKGAKPTGARKK